MRTKRVGMSALAVLLAAGLVSPPTARSQVTIEPIVKSIDPVRDQVPGRDPGFVFRGESKVLLPVMNSVYDVVFRAHSTSPSNSNSAWGLYVKRVGQPVAVLVDSTQTAGVPTFVVPGRPATARFLDFKAPILNNAGHVVFHANFTDSVGGSGSGIYMVPVTGGPVVKLMDTFDIVPGTASATVTTFIFSDTVNLDLTPAMLNDAGQVAFWAQFDSVSPTTGLFGTTVAGGAPVQLADRTITPTGVPFANAQPFVEVRPTYAMNSAGLVAFNGSIRIGTSTTLRPGVFRVPVTGGVAPETLAFHTQVAPGAGTATYVNFSTADIDATGQVAFTAGLNDSRTGIYAIASPTSPVVRIVDTGTGSYVVPNESPAAAFDALVITPMSESGQFGFWSRLRNATTPNNTGIYLAELGESTIKFVQDAAATAPGLAPVARLTNFLDVSAAINDAENLTFAAEGLNESGAGGLRGLYFFDNCADNVVRIVDSTQSLAVLGAAFSTLGSQTKKLQAYQGLYAVAGRYQAFTADNRVAFLAQFNNSEFGIYVATITTSGGGGQLEITCPADSELACPADTGTTGLGKATAIDRCSGATIPTTFVDSFAPACGPTGTISRVWTADDGQGNTVSCTQTIVIDDEVTPVLSEIPADAMVECDAVPGPAVVTVTDACDPEPDLIFHEYLTAGVCSGAYTLTRTWDAVDACGNGDSGQQIITVNDTTPPSVTCPVNQLTLACGADVSIAATGSASATDNCSSAVLGHNDVSTAGCGNTVNIARTWTATDQCGNANSCVQQIATTDTTGPTITCPPSETGLACGSDLSIGARGSATALDDCGPANVSAGDAIVDGCGDTVSLTRTWTAVDACGNSTSCAQSLSTADHTAPSITCPADQVGLACGSDLSPAATGTASAADACGSASVSFADASAGGCGGTQAITRTWTALDECGNTASCAQAVSTVDNTPPTITLPISEIVVDDANCSGNESVTLPEPTVQDACGSATVSNNAPSAFPAGQTTAVTYTATDGCGNASTAALDVTVEYGATIAVDALRFIVGLGHHPGITQQPLADIEVCAYQRGSGSCALAQCGVLHFLNFGCVVDNCAPVACAMTDEDGYAELHVPPGKYMVISEDVTRQILPSPLGTVVDDLSCGETELARLRQIQVYTGRRYSCKTSRLTGSELLIVEPEEVLWDETEQPYPFVFESVGDWDVTVTVAPPDGFVADHDELSESVDDEDKAVQFLITEVGSDLVPTKTTFHVTHNGRKRVVHSQIGISLTAEYARERGFNVAELRRKGLIKTLPAQAEVAPQPAPAATRP